LSYYELQLKGWLLEEVVSAFQGLLKHSIFWSCSMCKCIVLHTLHMCAPLRASQSGLSQGATNTWSAPPVLVTGPQTEPSSAGPLLVIAMRTQPCAVEEAKDANHERHDVQQSNSDRISSQYLCSLTMVCMRMHQCSLKKLFSWSACNENLQLLSEEQLSQQTSGNTSIPQGKHARAEICSVHHSA
jgi:hypothetical protein